MSSYSNIFIILSPCTDDAKCFPSELKLIDDIEFSFHFKVEISFPELLFYDFFDLLISFSGADLP